MRRFLYLLVLLFSVNATALAEPLPLEHFASLPDVRNVSLSPNGQYMASSVRVDVKDIKGRAVSIVDLETGEQKLPLMAKNDTYFITWMRWTSDTHLLVATMYPEIREQATGRPNRTKTRETSLFTINVETEKVQPIVSGRFLNKFKIKPVRRDNVIDTLPNDEEHILLSMTGHPSGTLGMRQYLDPLVYKVNLNNQNVETIQTPERGVYSWMTDRQHRLRLKRAHEDAQFTISVRDVDSDNWHALWEYQAFSIDEVNPLGFGKNPNELYIRAYHEGFMAVFKVDLEHPEQDPELIHSNPHGDVGGNLIYSRKTGEVIGISHTEGQGYVFWDEEYRNFQAAIDKALPDTKNHIYSFSRDESRYIVHASNSKESGTYYLGDRETGSLKVAAYAYKNLDPQRMSPKQTYNYEARDGLEIGAYLTLPRQRGDDEKLPTLVFPHGGPISATDDGFNYWTQFFANRGYAVLEMNFRGSSGKGHSFMKAGLKNWGKEMQDDVQDGALKLIEEGIADPDRICIVGASYGGYAALMGAVKTPDFYRCAASFAGVSDINDLLRRYRSRYAKTNIADLQVGDDKGALRQMSPLHRADEITVPVLLVHGAQDRQVRPDQSRDMHKALKKAGKDVTYIELDTANHYLTNNDDRVATIRAFEEFLARHLQPQRKTASAD